MRDAEALPRRGPEFHRLLRQEELILDVTEQFTQELRDAGLTQAALAHRLGRSPSFVSHLLTGSRNFTLRTVSDVASALSLRPSFVMTRAHKRQNRAVKVTVWSPRPVAWDTKASTQKRSTLAPDTVALTTAA